MSKALTNPLQALVKKAATSLPATTGKVATQQQRIERRVGGIVILADISGSMESPAWSDRRKIDVLREAVDEVMLRSDCRLIAFSREAREVKRIPDATEANTNLVAALEAARVFDPGQTLVISDGQPDNEAAALALARQFRGAIDVLYIGPDTDRAAISFMQKLAAAADGAVSINDLKSESGTKMLAHTLTKLLPAKKA